MKCPQCGAKVKHGKFCSKCGYRVRGEMTMCQSWGEDGNVTVACYWLLRQWQRRARREGAYMDYRLLAEKLEHMQRNLVAAIALERTETL